MRDHAQNRAEEAQQGRDRHDQVERTQPGTQFGQKGAGMRVVSSRAA